MLSDDFDECWDEHIEDWDRVLQRPPVALASVRCGSMEKLVPQSVELWSAGRIV